MRDELYKEQLAKPEKFEFSEKVAAVFDDMIRRSVPFYEANQLMTAQMTFEYYSQGSVIYDLGCSTGKTAEFLDEAFEGTDFIYTGIDNSAAMIERAQKRNMRKGHHAEFVLDNIETFSYDNAGVVISNYTFQFIPPERRIHLLKKIYDGLNTKGILLLSEKVIEADNGLTEHFQKMHHQMKKAYGYSDLEIIQKRDAIEDVLIPCETQENLENILTAGFKTASIYHKWYNFASYIAIK